MVIRIVVASFTVIITSIYIWRRWCSVCRHRQYQCAHIHGASAKTNPSIWNVVHVCTV